MMEDNNIYLLRHRILSGVCVSDIRQRFLNVVFEIYEKGNEGEKK